MPCLCRMTQFHFVSEHHLLFSLAWSSLIDVAPSTCSSSGPKNSKMTVSVTPNASAVVRSCPTSLACVTHRAVPAFHRRKSSARARGGIGHYRLLALWLSGHLTAHKCETEHYCRSHSTSTMAKPTPLVRRETRFFRQQQLSEKRA